MSSLSVAAPAKLNLSLQVTGRRADGYHELCSLVVFLAVADAVQLEPCSAISLSVDGAFAEQSGNVSQNLAVRAAHALAQRYAPKRGVAIQLTKQIPVGAGLGGGSADAAAVLRGLNDLWQLGLSIEQLCEVGQSLGADVPACIHAQPLMMRGIGHEIEPIPSPAPSWHVLLVNPRVHLATAEVYRALALPDLSGARRSVVLPANPYDLSWLRGQGNDLEAAAISLCPMLQELLNAIERQHGCMLARLCGSGATCFGVFETQAACDQAAFALIKEKPEWWVNTTRVLL